MATEVDSTARVAELEADCKELKGMLERSKRDNVRRELQRVLDMLEAELNRARAAAGTAVPAAAASEAAVPATASTAAPASSDAPKPKPAEPVHKPTPVVVKSVGPWTEITTFGLDLGGYDKPTISVDVRLKGVEQLPQENITCDFTEASFDLKVVGLEGQNYRFLRSNLDKDIVPADSSVKVKKNHVIIALQKVKGEYGYDSWTDLVAKGKRRPTATKKDSSNPQDSIMDMMKDLYEDGDDSMKKIIGEAMYKARRGEKYEPEKSDDFKMPSIGETSGLDDI
mmetsp:Transcript_141987/g.441487  ORF Transcript_141987/g.441487 Transcript_141987/m.441487 type:complete len:283 (+) Transcript_141987:101-949(+)